jgi:hypothetical protein
MKSCRRRRSTPVGSWPWIATRRRRRRRCRCGGPLHASGGLARRRDEHVRVAARNAARARGMWRPARTRTTGNRPRRPSTQGSRGTPHRAARPDTVEVSQAFTSLMPTTSTCAHGCQPASGRDVLRFEGRPPPTVRRAQRGGHRPAPLRKISLAQVVTPALAFRSAPRSCVIDRRRERIDRRPVGAHREAVERDTDEIVAFGPAPGSRRPSDFSLLVNPAVDPHHHRVRAGRRRIGDVHDLLGPGCVRDVLHGAPGGRDLCGRSRELAVPAITAPPSNNTAAPASARMITYT